MSIRLVHPCPDGKPTDRFGWRDAIPGVVAAQRHTGQDWAAPAGTPVRAMHAGRINRVWWDTMRDGSPAGGNMLQIGAAQCSSRYAHLSGYAVSAGDEVQARQIIGYVGRTGAATGNHLHAELLIGGQFVDPMPYITSTPNPNPTAVKAETGEEEMANHYIAKQVAGKQHNAIFNTTSGFCHEFESADGEYNTNVARTFGVVHPSSIVTGSQYDKVVADCARTRQGK